MTRPFSKSAFLAALWSATCLMTTSSQAQHKLPPIEVYAPTSVPMPLSDEDVCSFIASCRAKLYPPPPPPPPPPPVRSEALEELQRLWADYKDAPPAAEISAATLTEAQRAFEKAAEQESQTAIVNVHTVTAKELTEKTRHLDAASRKKVRDLIPDLKTDPRPPQAVTGATTPGHRLCVHNTNANTYYQIDGLPRNNYELMVAAHEIAGHCAGQQAYIEDAIRRSAPRPLFNTFDMFFSPPLPLNVYAAQVRAESEAEIISMYLYYGVAKDVKGLLQLAIARAQKIRDEDSIRHGWLFSPYAETVKDILAHPDEIEVDLKNLRLKPLADRVQMIMQKSGVMAEDETLARAIDIDFRALLGPQYKNNAVDFFPDSCGYLPKPYGAKKCVGISDAGPSR